MKRPSKPDPFDRIESVVENFGVKLTDAIVALLAAGVDEEREACAKLAEDPAMYDTAGGSTGNACGTQRRIAAAIRARTR